MRKKLLRMHEETDAAHGRVETRKIEVIEAGKTGWAGLRQWGKITRTRYHKRTKKTSVEEVFFITSLGETMIDIRELLEYNRRHWGVENKLHRNRDTLMNEDASTVRTGSAPQAMAAMRNLTLHYLNDIHNSPIIAREIAADNKNKTIQRITGFIK